MTTDPVVALAQVVALLSERAIGVLNVCSAQGVGLDDTEGNA